MNLLSAEAGDALVAAVVSRFLIQAEAAGIGTTDLSRLLGVPRLAIYRWRKDPDHRSTCSGAAFLNCLIATRLIQQGLAAGELPAASRKQSRSWTNRTLRTSTP